MRIGGEIMRSVVYMAFKIIRFLRKIKLKVILHNRNFIVKILLNILNII